MTDPSPALSRDPLTRRALELDALAAILPMDRRDRLVEILTDEGRRDFKASRQGRHGREQSSGARLRSRLSRGLGFAGGDRNPPALAGPRGAGIEIRGTASMGPGAPGADPSHGMPDNIAAVLRAKGLLRADGPHAPRRCAGACRVGRPCIIGKALAGPFKSPALRSAIRLAVRSAAAATRPEKPKGGADDVLRDVARDVQI